jgi:retron-type reverse transcriptase
VLTISYILYFISYILYLISYILYLKDVDKINAVSLLKKATPDKYKAYPVRRVMRPKPNKPGELRPLGIPTMFDRAVQALYCLALEPLANHTSYSYGFKEGLGTWDAITRLEKIVHSSPYPNPLHLFWVER